jgi:hypothetical protein
VPSLRTLSSVAAADDDDATLMLCVIQLRVRPRARALCKTMTEASTTTQLERELLDKETSFGNMSLDARLLQAVKRLGYEHPSLVQCESESGCIVTTSV